MQSRNRFIPLDVWGSGYMYDPSKKQFVYCDDADEEFIFDIKPRFINAVSAIMSSSTPFMIAEKFTIIYARMRIWIYDTRLHSLSGFPLMPERFVPYINIERIKVILNYEYVCVYEGCNILIVSAYGRFKLSDIDTKLYRLPSTFNVLNVVASNYATEARDTSVVHICAYNSLRRRYYYGTILADLHYNNHLIIPSATIKTIKWQILPEGEYTVRYGSYYQMIDGVETVIVPRSQYINVPTVIIE